MSSGKNIHEAERWLQTAGEDLEAAQVLREAGKYAHACFIAQQCGEKSMKALWYRLDTDPWGHSFQRLVKEFPRPDLLPEANDWLLRAAFLDRFYIPTRYPNGLPDLTPGQTYFQQDADQALAHGRYFLDQCQGLLKTISWP